MFPSPRMAVLFAFLFVASSCGSVHNYLITPPEDIGALKPLAIAPVDVQSAEKTDDALELNEQCKKIAADELQALLDEKHLAAAAPAQGTVTCKLDIVYGNRALRQWVGFGAGAGHMRVTIELKDGSGKIRYATNSESDLKRGRMGGDMKRVASKTIQAAVKEFGSRL